MKLRDPSDNLFFILHTPLVVQESLDLRMFLFYDTVLEKFYSLLSEVSICDADNTSPFDTTSLI